MQQAGLISRPQIEVALRDQTEYWDLLLGEILDLRGWVPKQTSDFFVKQFLKLQAGNQYKPIGLYLQEAALLNDQQIQKILQQQSHINAKFGTLAVHNGWLKLQTLAFLLRYLPTPPPSAQREGRNTDEGILDCNSESVSKSTILQLEQTLDTWIS